MPGAVDKVVIKEENLSSDEAGTSGSEDSDSNPESFVKRETKTEGGDVILDDSVQSASSHSREKATGFDSNNAEVKEEGEVKPFVSKKTQLENDQHDDDKDDIVDKKPKKKLSWKEREQKQIDKDNMARVKPNWTADRERERGLIKIATRGVVQLFNAVREQQNTTGDEKGKLKIEKQERKRGKTATKAEKEELFMQKLKKRRTDTSPAAVNGEGAEQKKKDKIDTDEPPKKKWKVFSDDFLISEEKKEAEKTVPKQTKKHRKVKRKQQAPESSDTD